MMVLLKNLRRRKQLPLTVLMMMTILSPVAVVNSRSVPVKSRAMAGPFNSIEYLAEYGYLSRAPMETGALRSQKDLETAIKEFQNMASLPMTGQLDQRTVEKMKTPRCGIVDKNSTSSGPQGFTLGPTKWPKTDITYRINNYSPDLYWGDIKYSVAQGFNIWAEKTPLNFIDVSDSSGPADIEIRFGSGNHNDGYAFDGRGNVLAHAFPPGEGRGGDAHFDEDEQWTVRSKEGTNLFTVAAHEFGHSLGIYHSNVQGALMYPWYQGYVPNLKLDYDDVKAIQTLYGGRGGKPPPTPPSTRSPQTITPPTIPTPRPTQPRWVGDDLPDTCSSDVDAVTTIRGEIFAFKDKYFWRMNRNGAQIDRIAKIREFWKPLPEEIAYIDAVYERQDGNFVFFKGNRLWEMNELKLAAGCPPSGKPLTAYGIDSSVTHIDAIFVWGLNGRTYIFSGYNYWRMNREGTKVEPEYPRPTDMWNGVPIPFDTVFTHPNQKTHFIKGTQYWAFSDDSMRADAGYPKPLRELWKYCPQQLSLANDRHASLSILVVFALLAITLNIFW